MGLHTKLAIINFITVLLYVIISHQLSSLCSSNRNFFQCHTKCYWHWPCWCFISTARVVFTIFHFFRLFCVSSALRWMKFHRESEIRFCFLWKATKIVKKMCISIPIIYPTLCLCMQGKHNLPVASLFMNRRKRLTLEHAKYAESSMIPRSKAICVFPSIVTLFVYTLYYFKQSTLNILENFTFILDSRHKKEPFCDYINLKAHTFLFMKNVFSIMFFIVFASVFLLQIDLDLNFILSRSSWLYLRRYL